MILDLDKMKESAKKILDMDNFYILSTNSNPKSIQSNFLESQMKKQQMIKKKVQMFIKIAQVIFQNMTIYFI